jgi:hypothetical protein
VGCSRQLGAGRWGEQDHLIAPITTLTYSVRFPSCRIFEKPGLSTRLELILYAFSHRDSAI